ncbi:MAG: Bug family tripartite tricarboxylate transporter substrate binding protein [Burkholderiales bacterium]
MFKPRAFVLPPALLAASLLLAAPAALAQAPQDFPNRPIHFVLGYPAGAGAVDIMARQLAAQLKNLAGVPIVIENKPGASTNIAAEYVARAKPDGHTLLITAGNSTFAANAYLFKSLPFDPVKSFAPITTLTSAQFILLVNTKQDVNSVADLTRLMKQKGSKGSHGVGAPISQAMAELYKSIAGLESVQIPYKTLGPAFIELANGGIDFIFVDSANASTLMKQSRARGIAVTSAKRSPSIPDLPTMIESGVPGFDATSWQAAYVPAGTPRPIIDRLSTWINRTMETEEFKKAMNAIWSDPMPGNPESLEKLHLAEIEKWARLLKAAKIEVQ